MADFPSPADIKELVSLFAPGLVIMAIRQRVVVGPRPELSDRLIAYALISAGYYAAIGPLFSVPRGMSLSPWLHAGLEYFVVPVVIGLVLARAYQGEWEHKAARRLGLRLAQNIPSAWDFAFERQTNGTYLLVTLSNGAQIAGLMDTASFASSNSAERDLLLEEVYDVGAGGAWTRSDPPRSILLCGKDIRHIELFA